METGQNEPWVVFSLEILCFYSLALSLPARRAVCGQQGQDQCSHHRGGRTKARGEQGFCPKLTQEISSVGELRVFPQKRLHPIRSMRHSEGQGGTEMPLEQAQETHRLMYFQRVCPYKAPGGCQARPSVPTTHTYSPIPPSGPLRCTCLHPVSPPRPLGQPSGQ